MKEVQIPYICSIKVEDIDTSEEIAILRKIHQQLRTEGYCYIKILTGDYKGSIAKFTRSDTCMPSDVVNYRTYSNTHKNVTCAWWGRLSWLGKRNNPQFHLNGSNCTFLDGYTGHTLLCYRDFKADKEDLLATAELTDVNDKLLTVGDQVLYINLRYGSGGKLSQGVVTGFKAHVRQDYVSLLVKSTDGEESELSVPHQQVYKFN